MSRPPRARGLKQEELTQALNIGVAPPAGAWIETGQPGIRHALEVVAPPAGAWIETED